MAKKEQTSKGKYQDAIDKLNKSYGQGTVVTLDNKSTGEYDIIPSGSLGMDYITLGCGGWVKGKLYELKGWESTGKSTICGHAAAECQKLGGTVLYIDGEHALDRNYFQQLGVDTSKMLISQPLCGEEGFNIAMEMIKTDAIDLIVIDSDSSLIPKAVLDGDVGDGALGKKARLNSNAYPKLKGALSTHNVCVIIISQYREKIGMMFGNPTTTQGGHALKFYSDCIIEVAKSGAKDGDVQYGNITKTKATKNKMGSPYRKHEFEIIYGKGIDKIKEFIELGNEFGILKKWGKSIIYYHKDGEIKYDVEEFKTLLRDNIDFTNSLKQDIIKKINETDIKLEEDDSED